MSYSHMKRKKSKQKIREKAKDKLVVGKKQEENKNLTSMDPTFVSVGEEHSNQLLLPQACQLLRKVLDDIIASEQKPTTTLTVNRQSVRSSCHNKTAHRWPEVWEPKTSLYIQIPKDQQLCTSFKKSALKRCKQISIHNSSQCSSKPISLPPLQQSGQITNTTGSKLLPRSESDISGATEVAKDIPRKRVKIANLIKIDTFPIAISVIPGFRRLPIIYHDWYNLQFTKTLKGHHHLIKLPDKPACVYSLLEKKFSVSKAHRCKFIEWRAADIFTIYDMSDYIPDSVKKCDILNTTRIMKIQFHEAIPNWNIFDNAVLHPLRIQMTGSVVACKLAMDEGWAVNLGGGFGYNTTQISKGLAVYDDIPVCLAIMSKLPNVEHILVVNCDLYQSPRYKQVKGVSCPVTIVDFYCEPINEPAVREPIFPFGCATNDQVTYHEHRLVDTDQQESHPEFVAKVLTAVLTDFSLDGAAKSSLCIYIAGTNVLGSNTPLGLTREDVIERDQVVFQAVQDDYDIPIAILLGGGYQLDDAETAAASIFQLCKVGIQNLKWHHRLTLSLK